MVLVCGTGTGSWMVQRLGRRSEGEQVVVVQCVCRWEVQDGKEDIVGGN